MTRRWTLGGLGVLAAGLAMLLLFEATSPSPGGAALPVAADDATPPLAAAPAETRDVSGWAETALGRPLFDLARQRQVSAAADRPDEALPRLSGIFETKGERRAVFQPEGERKPVVVGEGERVAGWSVRAIEGGAVTVEKDGGTRTLRPKFDQGTKSSQSGQGGR